MKAQNTFELIDQLYQLAEKYGGKVEHHYDGTYHKWKHHLIFRYPITYMSAPYESHADNDLRVCIETVLSRVVAHFKTTP